MMSAVRKEESERAVRSPIRVSGFVLSVWMGDVDGDSSLTSAELTRTFYFVTWGVSHGVRCDEH